MRKNKGILVAIAACILLSGCSGTTVNVNNNSIEDESQTDIVVETQEELAKKASDLFWGLDEENTDKPPRKKKKTLPVIEHYESESVKENDNSETDDDWTQYLNVEEEKPEKERKQANKTKRVICWGDSMTSGYGGGDTTYPGVLEEVSGAEVLNYGVFGETTKDIAAREGAIPLYSSSNTDLIIPQDTSPIILNVTDSSGGHPNINLFGNAGINPCSLAGVQGTFYHDDITGFTLFKRNEPGLPVSVPNKTPFITFASVDFRPDDILIIWCGNNDKPETIAEIRDTINWQKEMIKHSGAKDYAIISLTSASMLEQIDLINEMFKLEYGSHFIDLRSYVLTDMMDDAGITPTDKDLQNIRKGYVPVSLMDSDELHGNDIFYEYAGKFIYKKLQRMGYLE